MQSNRQLALQKMKEVCERATSLYGVDLSNLAVKFDLKGRAAGRAMKYGNDITIRLNDAMLHHSGADHIVNATVPHEVAHIVCFLKPHLGNGHDAGWERVCIALGGTGATRHTEKVAFAKGRTYEYTATCGTKVNISERIHNGIQRGDTRTLRRTRGQLNKECHFEIVAVSGQFIKPSTNAAPVQASAHVVPAAPVQRTAAPVQRTAAPVQRASGSKADLIRARIAQEKYRSGQMEPVIIYGVVELGMTRALASTYVKNNWNKV